MDMVTQHKRSDPPDLTTRSATAALEEDIQLAAETTVPVLISGPVSATRALAREVDRRSAGATAPVEIVDCRAEECHTVLEVLAHATPATSVGGRTRCLLLQEVHALAPDDQLLLERHLSAVRRREQPPTRILASSSVPLYPRVEEQLFSERLYYLLNVIHIVIPTARQVTRFER
jgi:DNA-binding NtrC family response regulator